MRIRPAALGPLLLVSACSGGGGTPAPAPTPTVANTAPRFTSAATASVAENIAAAYTAAATDAEGNPVTFSIAGGADAARFAITAGGALSFAPAPNFELPADADGNNGYLVQLRASDGALSATLDLTVTVTDSREGIAVRRVGSGFDQPVFVATIPGSGDVFVGEKGGNVYRFTPASGARTLALTVGGLSTSGERGLLGMALRANFTATGEVFVHCTRTDGTIEIREYRIGNPGFGNRVLVGIPHPGADNHNGGWIGFGPDGLLYVATGDGGGGGDPGNNAQNTGSRLGKILRLAESGGNWIAAPGNPFAGGGGDPYVFAYGLRNPFRNSFGPDGRLYIGDVGQGEIEEIDVLRPDQPGLNFGWPHLEGTMRYNGGGPAGMVAPVSQYAHGSGPTQGSTIIGGYVYRGPVASLVGSYVFADFISNNIWSVPAASLVQGSLYPAGRYERRNLDFTPDAGTIESIVSFGEDAAGNLFIVDIGGEIFMVVPG
ncbi:MAG: PQQ-dependent sugar dehydrogenase [Sphingomonas sp.]